MRRKLICQFLAFFFFLSWGFSQDPGNLCRPGDGRLKVGVLYSKDWKGRAMRDGVLRAVAEDRKANNAAAACIALYSYRGDADGEAKLISLIEKREVHVILGPSDSGVFQQALDQFEDSDIPVPVVSSLVTAPVGNTEGGWFFRTNVDDAARIYEIVDSLRPLWLNSAVLLYADTGYGRAAEVTFSVELPAIGIENYEAIPFGTDLISKRDAVKRVFEVRPETVAIVGTTEDIVALNRLARNVGQSIGYDPIVFTIIDASPIRGRVDRLLFVSVTDRSIAADVAEPDPAWEEGYEVSALSYDTAWMVLNLLRGRSATRFDKDDFRKELENRLSRSSNLEGPKSKSRYTRMSNQARLHIHKMEGLQIGPGYQDLDYWDVLMLKAGLVKRRFGILALINLMVVAVGVFLTTSLDVNKWFEGHYLRIYRHVHFYVLAFINVILTVAVYIYVCNKGYVSWGNFLMAVVIGVGPSVLLRATLFETPTGKAVGFADYYKGFIEWVSERIKLSRHRTLTQRINVIAYHNSERRLRARLRTIYNSIGEPERDHDLQRELDEAGGDTALEKLLARRLICARRLLRWVKWKDLYDKLIPAEFEVSRPVNPESVVVAAKCYCQENKLTDKVDGIIRKKIDGVKSQRTAAKMKKEYQEELDEAGSGQEFAMIRFLVVRFLVAPTALKHDGLLDANYEVLGHPRRVRFFQFIKRLILWARGAVLSRPADPGAQGASGD